MSLSFLCQIEWNFLRLDITDVINAKKYRENGKNFYRQHLHYKPTGFIFTDTLSSFHYFQMKIPHTANSHETR